MLLSLLLAAAAPVAAQAESPSKIIFYRGSSVFGAAVACPIRYKGRDVVELGRGKYAEWHIPPGSYVLTNKTASVETYLAQGETKYIRCQVKTGFLSGRADLQVVDQESFEQALPGLERKEADALTNSP